MEAERISELADATAAFNGSALMALANALAKRGAVDAALVEHLDALIELYFMRSEPGSPELRARGADYREMLRHPDLPLGRVEPR